MLILQSGEDEIDDEIQVDGTLAKISARKFAMILLKTRSVSMRNAGQFALSS
jgi:hypothetical protein